MTAYVEMRALPDHPGHTAYQITGDSEGEIQTKISEIMNGPNIVASEFHNPFRTPEGKYQTRGYVQRRIYPIQQT